jgi:hypothetical protein
MPKFPEFDGRQPLTARTVNDLVDVTRRNGRQAVGPGLNQYNLGSLGRISTSGLAYTQQGFWARLYVSPTVEDMPKYGPKPRPGRNFPKAPFAWFVEQMTVPGIDQNTGLPAAGMTLVDNPRGRSGFVEDLHLLFQSVVNLGIGTSSDALELALAGYTVGTFTITITGNDFNGNSLPDRTTGPLDWPPTLNSIRDALESLTVPGVSGWTVTAGPGSQQSHSFSAVISGIPSDPTRPDFLFITVNTSNLTGVGINDSSTGTVVYPGSRLLNINPHGQLIFAQGAVAPDGSQHYFFQLPYIGMWGRIVGPVPLSAPPAYTFIEQFIPSTPYQLIDNPGGVQGFAYEINGETCVPPNTNVWLVPLFVGGVGFRWIFQCNCDWRIVHCTGGPVAPNGTILLPRNVDTFGFGTAALGSIPGGPDPGVSGAYVTAIDGGALPAGYYFAQRQSFLTAGYPTFVAASSLGSGFSGSYNGITVVNGRVTSLPSS